MAGAATMNERFRRWWRAPAALEVLVGPDRYSTAIFRSLIVFGGPSILLGFPFLIFGPTQPGLHRGALIAVVALALAAVLVILITGVQLQTRQIAPAVLLVAGLVGYGVPLFGPNLGEAATMTAACTAVAALWVPRRWAVAAVMLGGSTYGVSLRMNHFDEPVARWAAVMMLVIVLLVSIARVLDMVIDLAADERAAQAEVAELNRTLADQVQAQVAEIEGLGHLRRFLSPQVADAVLGSGGAESDALKPHRRQIAVVFCDLRGFTAFSNTVEPEYVLEILDDYYNIVGEALRHHQATVGAFQGDGIMAYFNDPVPCDDPPGTAVAMLTELRGPLDGLVFQWTRRGYDLGYGCGLAYGYATLGTVGFDDRNDYTPVGPVVNLAARLCDEADRGEILIDSRAYAALSDPIIATECHLTLKGFDRPVLAHRLPPLAR